LAIGRKNTWEKDGVTVTPVQIVVGALIGLAVVLFALITPVITVHPMRDLKTWKPRWEGIAARDTGERSGFGTTGTK
jgi:hypothetical protein